MIKEMQNSFDGNKLSIKKAISLGLLKRFSSQRANYGSLKDGYHEHRKHNYQQKYNANIQAAKDFYEEEAELYDEHDWEAKPIPACDTATLDQWY